MDVRRSVADPAFDAAVNVLGMINMLEGAREVGVQKVLFASSGGATYGEQDEFPAPRDATRTIRCRPTASPRRPASTTCSSTTPIYGMPYTALRYANVYGPRQDPHGEAGVVAIFTERLLANQPPTINGDGKQTRDYVFVGDVVRANLAALERPFVGSVNIGTGIETDVTHALRPPARADGQPASAQHGPAKAGEQRRSVIAIDRAAKVARLEAGDSARRRTAAHGRVLPSPTADAARIGPRRRPPAAGQVGGALRRSAVAPPRRTAGPTA